GPVETSQDPGAQLLSLRGPDAQRHGFRGGQLLDLPQTRRVRKADARLARGVGQQADAGSLDFGLSPGQETHDPEAQRERSHSVDEQSWRAARREVREHGRDADSYRG